MLKLQLDEKQHRLRMDGDLEGSFEDEGRLEEVFRQIETSGGEWIIVAVKMRLIPQGASLWAKLATEVLQQCTLVYEPSQLGLVLRYEDKYEHRASRFIETWEKAPHSLAEAETLDALWRSRRARECLSPREREMIKDI